VNFLDSDTIQDLLQRPGPLTKQITHRLHERYSPESIFASEKIDSACASAVLFLLGQFQSQNRLAGKPCLILNKRSANVRQAGDLCCPGGRVNLHLDGVLATLLKLPIGPLARWSYRSEWLKLHPRGLKWLRLFLATGLRESAEEMRLNPFGLKFLGPLPPQPLLMFQRIIYPMVMWITGQKRFYPNWEVDKIIYIPLRDLLNAAQYARYRVRIETRSNTVRVNTFPCFRYESANGTELLWGATYRITMVFLRDVFSFVPPAADSVPLIHGRLSRAYLNDT
jgi:hypothetical protein